MNTEWSLDEIYKGFDDKAYEADFKTLEEEIKKFGAAVKATDKELLAKVEELLSLEEKVTLVSGKLSLYIGLRQSVNTDDGEIMAQANRLRKVISAGSAAFSAASKLYATIPDIAESASKSELVAKYTYKLEKAKPVLEKLPGWKCDIRGIRSFDELPENCRKYVEFIEEQIGFPITMVSNGPGREDIIYRESPLKK